MFGLPPVHACVPEGGAFALVIPPLAIALLALEAAWLFAIGTRELKRRSDLLRIRDLLIEGSIGQAILLSDRRQRDDVLGVCRAGIVAIQGTGDRDQAFERIALEARLRFGTTMATRAKVALIAFVALIPAGLGLGGRAYAERVARAAAADLPEERRAAVLAEVRGDLAFGCPLSLGFTGVLVLAIPAVAIGWLELARRSGSTRRRAVDQAAVFVDMAAVVLDPATRAYKEERRRSPG